MVQISGSISTKTGLAPKRIAAIAQEMIVKEGMMISSPFFIPAAYNAVSNAAVPLQTAMPYLEPKYEEKMDSNFSTNGPSEDIQPESIHCISSSFSLPFSNGSLTGII